VYVYIATFTLLVLLGSIAAGRTFISRGIGSFPRSRTNKLSPNIAFAWGGMHTSNRDGQYWSMENQHALLKERLTLKHHSAGLPGPSISRGPDRHFSFVALAGETAFKYNLPERERHLHTEQGCVTVRGARGQIDEGGGGYAPPSGCKTHFRD